MPSVILAAQHVTKTFSVRPGEEILALRDVHLEVAEGEFLCLLGASGCGKSTLLNMFAGFIAPSNGEILLRSRPITGIDPRCGMVFQSYALFPWRTVRQNVEFGPKMKGLAAAERRRISDRFIEMVRLQDFVDHYPAELSGGMQQRVTLARCLAADPEVLLMDEPFAALDAMTRDDMQRLLADVWKETRKTVIYVTHNVAEAVYLADRVVVMSAHPGTVKTIMKIDLPRPRDPLSVEFLECQKELMGHLGHTTNGAAH
jgi:NitT/TauT family transport system ATP-binding protein